jgi:hypothetical protein
MKCDLKNCKSKSRLATVVIAIHIEKETYGILNLCPVCANLVEDSLRRTKDTWYLAPINRKGKVTENAVLRGQP